MTHSREVGLRNAAGRSHLCQEAVLQVDDGLANQIIRCDKVVVLDPHNQVFVQGKGGRQLECPAADTVNSSDPIDCSNPTDTVLSPASTNPCPQSVQPQQIHVLSPAPTNPCPQSVQPQQIHVLSQSSPNKSMSSIQRYTQA